MKSGKKIKIKNHNNYNVSYGCVDNKNPKSVFVNLTSWLEPLSEDEEDYSKIIKQLNKKIKQFVYDYFSNNKENFFIKDKTIIDLDLRESGIRFGKKSFMSCELTLFQNGNEGLNTEIMQKKLNEITTLVINEIFNKNKNFKYHKKKE